MKRRRWNVTEHAVSRYIERCAPELSFELARAILHETSQRAVLVGRRRDARLYRDPQRPMHLECVVSPDGTLVTVTNPFEQPNDIGREVVYAPVRRTRRVA